MTWPEIVAWSLLTAAGLIGSALCSGMEMGLYAASRVRVDIAASMPHRGGPARVLRRELDHPEGAIATLLVGNNAANYAGVAGITALLGGAGLTDIAVVVINALILTPILVVLCESLPKEVFRQQADRLAVLCAPALAGARVALTFAGVLPLILVFGRVAMRLIGESAERWSALGARDRLAKLLEEGAAQGALSVAQATLVERAMRLRDAVVEDEMSPWSSVSAARESWARARVVAHAAAHALADVPVVDGRGRVIGVVWMPDLVLREDEPWRALMRAPARLGAKMPVLDAMRAVIEAPARVGIVEHHGRPVGLVTLDDLAEPLTGGWRGG